MKRHMRYGVGAAIVLALFCAPVLAHAQDDDSNSAMQARINQLENQVQDLSRKAYGSSYVPGQVSTSGGAGGAMVPAVSANMETRVSALETQIRDLTGQVERANFNAQQANTNLDKLKSDLDIRFQQLQQQQAASVPAAAVAGAAAGADAGTLNDKADKTAAAPDADDTAAAPDATAAAPATPEELYNRAFGELQQKQYGAAEKDFRDFLAQNSGHKLAPNAEYWLGESYFARQNYKASSAVFAESYQKYPKAIKAPDSLLKLGLSLEAQNRSKDACTVFRQLTKEYPTASGSLTTRTETELKKLKCS
jgi:tol-pal system protein YbgF